MAADGVRVAVRASRADAAALRRACIGAVVAGQVCKLASLVLTHRLPAGSSLLNIVWIVFTAGGVVASVVGQRRIVQRAGTPGDVRDGWLVVTDDAVRLHRTEWQGFRAVLGEPQVLPRITALAVGDRRAQATFADGSHVSLNVLRGSAELAAALQAHPLTRSSA
jgi:hypothetical protein